MLEYLLIFVFPCIQSTCLNSYEWQQVNTFLILNLSCIWVCIIICIITIFDLKQLYFSINDIGYNVEDLNFAFDITQFTSASVFYIKYCPKL